MLHLEGIRADAELQPRTTRDGRSQRGGQLEQQSVPEHLRQQQLMREDSAAHRNDGEDGNSSAGCKLQQSEDEHFALLGEAGTDRGNYGSFDDSDRFLQRSGSFMDLESDGFVGGRQLARYIAKHSPSNQSMKYLVLMIHFFVRAENSMECQIRNTKHISTRKSKRLDKVEANLHFGNSKPYTRTTAANCYGTFS